MARAVKDRIVETPYGGYVIFVAEDRRWRLRVFPYWWYLREDLTAGSGRVDPSAARAFQHFSKNKKLKC